MIKRKRHKVFHYPELNIVAEYYISREWASYRIRSTKEHYTHLNRTGFIKREHADDFYWQRILSSHLAMEVRMLADAVHKAEVEQTIDNIHDFIKIKDNNYIFRDWTNIDNNRTFVEFQYVRRYRNRNYTIDFYVFDEKVIFRVLSLCPELKIEKVVAFTHAFSRHSLRNIEKDLLRKITKAEISYYRKLIRERRKEIEIKEVQNENSLYRK